MRCEFTSWIRLRVPSCVGMVWVLGPWSESMYPGGRIQVAAAARVGTYGADMATPTAWLKASGVALCLGLSMGPASTAATAAPGGSDPTVAAPSSAAGKTARPVEPRRFWVKDKHHYRSPWYAGTHRRMINYGCTRAPYYAPSPRCSKDRGFHHGVDIAMRCGNPLYAAFRGRVVNPRSAGALGSAYGKRAFFASATPSGTRTSSSLTCAGCSCDRVSGSSGASASPAPPTPPLRTAATCTSRCVPPGPTTPPRSTRNGCCVPAVPTDRATPPAPARRDGPQPSPRRWEPR